MKDRKLFALMMLNVVLCVADAGMTYIVETPVNYSFEGNPFIKSNRDLLLSRIFYFTVVVPIFAYIYKREMTKKEKIFSYICLCLSNIILFYGVLSNLIGLVILWKSGII